LTEHDIVIDSNWTMIYTCAS